MKIKDSLDLNGWVLSNFCIQSDSDLDTYKGKGRKLLYSGNATDEKHNREVIMGLDDKWRVAAYLDDIAAIQEQLDLLTGEVDTSELISNLEDVLNFLNNIKENDGDLMTMLNGKLNTSGGILGGNLYIGAADNTSYLYQMYRRGGHGFRINNTGSNAYMAFGELYSAGKDLIAEKVLEFGDSGFRYSSDGGSTYNTILTSAGGTISGDIVVAGRVKEKGLMEFHYTDGTQIFLAHNKYAGSDKDGKTLAIYNGTWCDILHSGNIGEYAALISDDIFAEGQPSNALGYSYSTSSGLAQAGPTMVFGKHNYRAYLYGRDGALKFNTVENGTLTGWKTIAFTDSDITGNAGSANILATSYAENINYAAYTTHLKLIKSASEDYVTNGFPVQYVSGLSVMSGYTGWQMVTYGNPASNMHPYFRAVGGEGDWQAWKQLAFLDDNVASAQALTHSNGTVGATVGNNGAVTFYKGSVFQYDGNNIAYFGSAQDEIGNTYDGALMFAYKKPLYFYTGDIRMLINSSGNVTIGNTDLAETKAKLYVDGPLNATGLAYLSGGVRLANATYISSYIKDDNGSTTITAKSIMGVNASNNLLIAYGLQTTGATGIYGKRIYFAPNGEAIRMLINESGNVLIGTTTDGGQKLQVEGTIKTTGGVRFKWGDYFDESGNFILNQGSSWYVGDGTKRFLQIEKANGNTTINGDLHVTGNIIADKEVSAGGAAEESGEGGGGTGGGVEPYVFTFTPSTTTVSVNHNISSEDVIVQVYEKDTTSGKWSVVLVDIEIVDSTRVDLHFGRTETTEHKVVIIG